MWNSANIIIIIGEYLSVETAWQKYRSVIIAAYWSWESLFVAAAIYGSGKSCRGKHVGATDIISFVVSWSHDFEPTP